MSVSQTKRDAVRRRAAGACEYCRLPEHVSLVPHQVDHVVARQHGGSDEVANLCLCCIRCNLKKGPNIAGIDPASGRVVALFHPRRDAWEDHFTITTTGSRIEGTSALGRATVGLLDMNDVDRVALREFLAAKGR